MKNVLFLVVLLQSSFCLTQTLTFPFNDHRLSPDERAEDLISRLTLKEKVAQMQDVSPAIPRLGIPEYNWWNECLHGVARAGRATSFPQAIGMAASWNKELMYKVADVISTEARAKFNYSVSLGQRKRYQGLTMWTPNINIFRDPRWGRGQETYGEDPYLTSRMAVSFVKGLQGNNPAYFKTIATPKHYAVHSGPEYNRHSFDAYTDKRDLWETYLPAFEAAIVEGKAFSIMSAYNRYLGESATASPLLLNEILRDKWGFEGYVVSDCGAVADIYQYHKIVDTGVEAAAMAVKAGCDLNCGNTFRMLVEAVEKGLIEEKEIDIALKRLIVARVKLGLLNEDEEAPFKGISTNQLESEYNKSVALQMARESVVLLKNDKNLLPLSKNLDNIVVIGPNANNKHFALGNYFGVPTNYTTIVDGIRSKISKKTNVRYFKGTNLTNDDRIFDVIDKHQFKKGVEILYYNNSNFEGEPIRIEKSATVDFEWGGAAPIDLLTPGDFSIKYSGNLKADFIGEVALGVVASGGSYHLFIDGKEVLSDENGNGTKVQPFELNLESGKVYKVELNYSCTNPWMASIQLMWDKEERQGSSEMMNAVLESDVVIFVGGITARLEGEEMPVEIDGFHKGDRTHLKIPKPQLDLLKKVHQTGKPVVLAAASGSALALNWEQANLPAILQIWYPGQEGGNALADILFGDYNPSGKLPVTFYKTADDLPPFEDYHMKGRTYRYFEGEVLYPFGYGLSYSNFEIGKPVLSRNHISNLEKITVKTSVKNAGDYDGETVLQLYVKDLESSRPKPLISLKKFEKIFLKKGEVKQVSFELDKNDLSIVNADGEKVVEEGMYHIIIGNDAQSNNFAALNVSVDD